MKNINMNILRGAAAIALLSAVACGDDTAKVDGGGSGSGSGSGIDGSPQPVAFHQVEQLARPGINEALLITNAFMNGYNATAPTFAGVDSTTLNAVVGEGKTVLKAIYLGTCVIDGEAGFTADTGFKPAGLKCGAVGKAGVIGSDGKITAAAGSGAQAYADKVFGQFEPDVMRIDTSIAASNYGIPCGDLSSAPLLCGGRGLKDDTIDVTYAYLIGGLDARAPLDGGSGVDPTVLQLQALISDGVQYSKTASKNVDNATAPDPKNTQQGHPEPLATFPYSATPF